MPLNPPRDASGNVTPHNDPAIANDSWVIRNIDPANHVVPDKNTGRLRISSGAFSASTGDPDNGMSVDVGQVLTELALPQAAMVPVGMGAVRLKVADVRNLQLDVGSDPMPNNPAHGQVWRVKSTKKQKLHSIVADWVVSLPGVALR